MKINKSQTDQNQNTPYLRLRIRTTTRFVKGDLGAFKIENRFDRRRRRSSPGYRLMMMKKTRAIHRSSRQFPPSRAIRFAVQANEINEETSIFERGIRLSSIASAGVKQLRNGRYRLRRHGRRLRAPNS